MSGNAWARSTAPMSEIVAMTMRTQLGACLVDPELGVDWARVSKNATGASALARTTIETALARYVRAGQIANLAVTCEVSGGRLLYEISYRDPRATTLVRTRLTGAI